MTDKQRDEHTTDGGAEVFQTTQHPYALRATANMTAITK